MTVVFGWNTYLLKKISPEELGILSSAQSDIQLEYRQKYFHIFFIPIFPIGRFWAVRQERKLYHPAPELTQVLQTLRPAGKHGVWAWTGPLLVIAGFLIYNVSASISERAWAKRMETHAGVLAAFFQDKPKINSLTGKLKKIDALLDSSLMEETFAKKRIDTSEAGLIRLFIDAKLTQADSLTGYTRDNTLVESNFHGSGEKTSVIISESCRKSLEAGAWNGYYTDTSVVFPEVRKLENYKYILLLKEYNRSAPVVMDSGYASGYSLANASIIEIATGKAIKTFKVMAGNSDKVQQFSLRGNINPKMWLARLQADLKNNVVAEATKYVFGKQALH